MELKDAIIDDSAKGIFRVHRSSMTSPEIYQTEVDRIFEKCWLYVGHESEVPNRGDYLRRTVGGWPVMFVRGSDGEPRVFLNTCPHRGALVCRQDKGNANLFQCFYHAWTFNNKGDLVGTPEEDGYAEGFDPAERSLQPPPRVENYRGMIFLSYNPNVEDLDTYLGDARVFIDTFLNQAGEDGLRVLPGSYKYSIRANWKLMVENSVDGYHGFPTHITWMQYLDDSGKNASAIRRGNKTYGVALGRGHMGSVRATGSSTNMYLGSRVRPTFSGEAKERLDQFRQKLVKRYGPEMEQWDPAIGGAGNFLIYPNLLFVHGMKSIRLVWPAAQDLMELTAWAIAPKSQSDETVRELNRDEFFDAQGPGGFQGPDDYEALESCQLGFVAKTVEYSDISRGMHRLPLNTDELQMRAFWRQWHADLQGLPKMDNTDDWSSFEAYQRAVEKAAV